MVTTPVKVCLVFPNVFLGHYLQGEIPVHPSLALGYLAAVLKGNGHEVHVIDASALKLSGEQLLGEIERIKPEVVGITTNIGMHDKASHTARMIRRRFPTITVLMGGPWATIEHARVLRSGVADAVVCGEGETTIIELLSCIRDKGSWACIAGIAFLDDQGNVVKTPARALLENLDALPFPAWELFPSSKHYKFMHRRSPFFPVMTSRGCPYDCIHCTKVVHGYKFRARSVENVIQEIKFLKERFNVREIFIIDDNFNQDISRAERILDRIIEENLDLTINFTNGVRADKITPRLAWKFRVAGVYSVALGIESGNQNIVNAIGKRLDLASVSRAVRLLKREGIVTRGFFIIGHPHDTYDTMVQTLRYAKELDLEYPHFFKSIPFPGTKMHDLIEREGKVRKDVVLVAKDTYNTRKFAYDIWDLHAEDVEKVFNLSYRLFYLRPLKMAKLFSKIRSRSEFWWLFRSFLNIIVKNFLS